MSLSKFIIERDIPKVGSQTMVCNDCPAALMPNGKVLVTAAQFLNNDWGNPIHFFEYDPAQTRRIVRLAQGQWPAADISVHKDLAGRDRVVRIQLP